MPSFPGGSAWAMARDIAEGHILANQRTFVRLSRAQLEQVSFELEKRLRQIRASPVPEESLEMQVRNRRLSRLTGAQRILQGVRAAQRG